METLSPQTDNGKQAPPRVLSVEHEPGPSLAVIDEWYARRGRAVGRAIPEAVAAARRNGVPDWVPIDLLGEPIDPSPAGRLKAERASFLATGYPATHPAEGWDSWPPDEVEDLERMDDEVWAETSAPMRRRRWSR